MGCAAISPRPRGRTCARAGISPKSPPTKANSSSRRCRICIRGAVPGSPWASTTTPSWPGRRCAWPSRSEAGSVAGVLFHSDQGDEHTGTSFVNACRIAGVTQSVGRAGYDPGQRGPESFNSPLEFELVSRHRLATREQVGRAVVVFISNTTAIEGIPPAACPARSTRNANAQRDAPPSRDCRDTAEGAPYDARFHRHGCLSIRVAQRYGAHPSGLKGCSRDRCATGLRAALDPEALYGPHQAAAGAGPGGAGLGAQGRARTIKKKSLQPSLYGYTGLPGFHVESQLPVSRVREDAADRGAATPISPISECRDLRPT